MQQHFVVYCAIFSIPEVRLNIQSQIIIIQPLKFVTQKKIDVDFILSIIY